MGNARSLVVVGLVTLALTGHVGARASSRAHVRLHRPAANGHRLRRRTSVQAQAAGDLTYRWGEFLTPGEPGSGGNGSGVGEAAGPVAVKDLTDVTAIAAGNGSDMALAANGSVWTWGSGALGSLGDGSTNSSLNIALEVMGLPRIVAIAESENTDVALAANGTVWGWGYNRSGQLCTGNTFSFDHPVKLGLTGVASMAGAGDHTLFLMADGSVEACGDNTSGELGDGTFTTSRSPVSVVGLPSDSPVVAVSAAWRGSSALLADGQVWDWGYGAEGQLGDGKFSTSDVPVEAPLPSPAAEM